MAKPRLNTWKTIGIHAALVTVGAAGNREIRVVSLEGSPTPTGGIYDRQQEPPVISEDSRAVFLNPVFGGSGGGIFSVLTDVEGVRLVGAGDAVSGLDSPLTYPYEAVPSVGPGSFAALFGRYRPPGSSGTVSCVIRAEVDSGTLTAVMLEGESGLVDQALVYVRQPSSFSNVPAMNGAGQIAASVSLFGGAVTSNTDESILRFDPGVSGATLIVRKGGGAPGGGSFTGTAFQSSEVFASPTIDGLGRVAFVAEIEGGSQSGTGVFIGDGSTISSVAQEDTPVPGRSEFFDGFTAPRLAESGFLVFASDYAGNSSLDGVFAQRPGSPLQSIALSGDPVPDHNGSFRGTFRTFDGSLMPNATEKVLFVADTTEPDGIGEGLFIGGLTSVLAVARTGDPAPDGGTFSAFDNFPRAINDAGDCLFLAGIDIHPDASTIDEIGLYSLVDGTLQKIIRTGDPFLSSTVDAIGFSGAGAANDFNRSGMNSRAEAAFRFELSNGLSGIAVSGEPWASPCLADLAPPFRVLDLADIVAFVTAFSTMDTAVDFDANGLFDLTDITLFIASFTSPCPELGA